MVVFHFFHTADTRALHGIQNDHRRLFCLFHTKLKRPADFRRILPVHPICIPSKGLVFHFHIPGFHDPVICTVDLLFIPVQKYKQVLQSVMRRKLRGFPDLPFCRFSVSRDAKDSLAAVFQPASKRKAAGNRKTLSKTSCRGIHTGNLQPVAVTRQIFPWLIQRV